MMWLRECPFDDQGLLRPVIPLSLMCDTCGSVWCTPDDASSGDRAIVPEPPDWSACGNTYNPDTTRWATRDEVAQAGWSDLPWHEEST